MKQLCAQAACEQDPEKLMALIEEIDRMLSEKMDRLKPRSAGPMDDVHE